MNKLKSLQYPWKLYIWLALLVFTVIDLAVLLDIQTGSGRRPYRFMIWNYFLAWIPAVAVIGMDGLSLLRKGLVRNLSLVAAGLVWLFFHPNATYLLTDLLHVFRNYAFDRHESFWNDIGFWRHLLPMLWAAMIGLLIGSVSLYSVHRLVERAWGWLSGAVFAVVVLVLSSFGVYMGRFIRWNSWDVLGDPLMLVQDMRDLFSDPAWVRHLVLFGGGILALQAGLYLILYLFAKMGTGEQRHEA